MCYRVIFVYIDSVSFPAVICVWKGRVKCEMNQSKKYKGSQLFRTLLVVLLLIGCIMLLRPYFLSFTNGENTSFREYALVICLLLLGFVVAVYLQMIFYTIGHLIFGLLSGYRFSSIRIGKYMWLKTKGKIRFCRLTLAGMDAQCLLCPPDLVDGKIPFVLYNLGGCIMNFITFLLCMGLYFFGDSANYLTVFFGMMAIIGLGSALLNGIPMRTEMIYNAGYDTKVIAKSPVAMRAFWTQMKINEQTAQGVRLRDMPEEWFTLSAEAELQNSMTAAMAVFCEGRFMDAHAFEKAQQLIQWLQSSNSAVTGLHSRLLACDLAYCAFLQGDCARGNEILQEEAQMKFMRQMCAYPSVIRTEYAAALLYDKDAAKAEQIRSRFEKAAQTYPYEGDLASERELMDLVYKKAVNAHERSATP